MSQISFVETRARRKDPETSKRAAKTAAGGKAGELRRHIQYRLEWVRKYHDTRNGLTARELAQDLDADYYDVQRRLSETANIRKTGAERDGQMIWEYAPC